MEAEWSIRGNANGKHAKNPWIRQTEKCRERSLAGKENKSQCQAYDPRPSGHGFVNPRLGAREVMLGNQLGADNLKRERHGGGQHQQRDGRGDVPKLRGAHHPRHGYVVKEIYATDQSVVHSLNKTPPAATALCFPPASP